MGFGARLAEERKRLGLKQADFADLVGTDVPKQSLYENDRRELRAEYLARLVEADVDVVYILSGCRSGAQSLGAGASALLSAYLALPPDVRDSLVAFIATLSDQFTRAPGTTLHGPRQDYRAGDAAP
jgi:transcriptional regulator with XRE-family HTH domain